MPTSNPPIVFPAGQPITIQDALTVLGNVNLKPSVLNGNTINPSLPVPALAQESRDIIPYTQPHGSTIASETRCIYAVKSVQSPGAVVDDFRAAITGQIMTGDRTVSVDLQKSTGGGAFASILSGGGISFTASDSVRTPKLATITSPNLVAGDLLAIVVVYTAGTTGTVPQGLLAQTNVRELPA